MILITGSKGQMGTDLKKLLKKNKIYFLAKNKKNFDISKKINFINIDKYKNVRIIINLAAITNVDFCENNLKTSLMVHAQGVKNLVILSNKLNATLIHISTDYVFNGNSIKPYTEKNSTNPINNYGYSKLESEKIIISQCNKFYIIRTSWVFSNYKNNFLSFVRNSVRLNDEINLITDQFGNPTSTNSLSFVLLKFINLINSNNNNIYGIYNFCNFPKTNWYKFGKFYIKNNLNSNIQINKITENDLNLSAKRPKFTSLNISKLNKYLQIKKFFWKNELKKIN